VLLVGSGSGTRAVVVDFGLARAVGIAAPAGGIAASAGGLIEPAAEAPADLAGSARAGTPS